MNLIQVGGWGFLICKEDVLGNILWQKSYSQGKGVLLRAMIATDDGGYIMSGQCFYVDTNFTVHYGSSLNPDIGILKVDSLGNKVWSKVIGGTDIEDVFSMAVAPGGGCYIVGSTESTDYDCTGNHGEQDVYLARLDYNGNLIWHNDLGGSGDDGFYYLGWCVADGKGGVLIATGSNSNDGDIHHHIGDYDYWVVDMDSNNNVVWDNCYGSTEPEFATSICKATDGSIWITGESSLQGGEVDSSYGNGDAWVVHADSVGNFINAKVLGSSQTDLGTMVYPTATGGVIVGGNYSNGDGAFSSIQYYGTSNAFNAFLATFSPENQTSVKQAMATRDVYIFPNPATDILNISVINYTLQIDFIITINNIFGESMYNNNMDGEKLQIDVSQWPKGIYYVQLIGEDGAMLTTKLIKY